MKYKFSPAIYEHKAKLINKLPYEVSKSAELLTLAIQKEFEIYKPDFLTVGLDIYNLELEAMGIKVLPQGENCPELDEISLDFDIKQDIFKSGRFELMIEVANNLKSLHVPIRIAATGPVTMVAKIVGSETMLMDLILGEGRSLELLREATLVTRNWCEVINKSGFDAIIFDSMSAPPLFSPAMYEEFVLPLHRDIMEILIANGQIQRELVIGGNTTPIVPFLKQTLANILLCDYAVDDVNCWKNALGDDSLLQVRRNINPAKLDEIDFQKLESELKLFTNPILGTGILPYHFDDEKLKLKVKKLC